MESQKWVYNDGGRSNYFSGKHAGDCVTRAVAIASGIDYLKVYNVIARGNSKDPKKNRHRGEKSARNGVRTRSKWFRKQMQDWGWVFKECKTYENITLGSSKIPKGNIICWVDRHYVAVIDGVVNDTFNPDETKKIRLRNKDGKLLVKGYWVKK